MLNMDLTVFCKDTLTGDVVSGCLGKGRDITYLDWIFSAWGWTVGVSLTALAIALIVGSIVGALILSFWKKPLSPEESGLEK